MIGILAEKPSQARAWQAAMRAHPQGGDCQIVASRGHLYEFAPPHEQVEPGLVERYQSWDTALLPWNPADLAWRRVADPGARDTIERIRATLAKADEIVIATDDDPTGEGDLLAWEILEETGLAGRNVTRARFADETAQSLLDAFNSRQKVTRQDGAYRKALWRSQWDFLSMQFTRLATGAAGGQTLRQGRLKTVIVDLVGRQEAARAAFKKTVSYYRVYQDAGGNRFAPPEPAMYKREEDVPAAPLPQASVMIDTTTRTRVAPPKLLDLAGACARLAETGHDTNSVLDTAQHLYEAGILSYPRTEDTTITRAQYDQMTPQRARIATLVGVDPDLLTVTEPRRRHVGGGQLAHGAIRPGTNIPDTLDQLDQYGPAARPLYTLLARSALMMWCPDMERDTTRAHLVELPDWTATSTTTASPGWNVLADKPAKDDAPFTNPARPAIGKHEPKPPEPPSMRWLMKQLEHYDVGTGATRAATWRDLTRGTRAPLKDTKGVASLTGPGHLSYTLMAGTRIADPATSEHVHQTMRAIGQDPATDTRGLLGQVADMVNQDRATIAANARNLTGPDLEHTRQTERVSTVFDGQPATWKRTWAGHRFTDEEVAALNRGDSVTVTYRKNGAERTVTGHLALQEYQGRTFLGFAPQWAPKTGGGLPQSWCGHQFTPAELDRLRDGKSVSIHGARAKSGKQFDCTLAWQTQADGTRKLVPTFGH